MEVKAYVRTIGNDENVNNCICLAGRLDMCGFNVRCLDRLDRQGFDAWFLGQRIVFCNRVSDYFTQHHDERTEHYQDCVFHEIRNGWWW